MNLSKFGVPLDGNNLGILHPKQKYRFRVTFQDFGDNGGLREMTANVMTATRPKPTFEDIKLDAYNSVAWIAGKHSWEPVEIKLRDDITNSVLSSVGAQVQKQMNMYEQTSAVAGINYKFAMRIDSLDGTTNEEIESWDLEGCFLTSVAYPEGDYASGDVSEITLTIRYDNAIELSGPNNLDGLTVGQDPFPNPAPNQGQAGATFA